MRMLINDNEQQTFKGRELVPKSILLKEIEFGSEMYYLNT